MIEQEELIKLMNEIVNDTNKDGILKDLNEFELGALVIIMAIEIKYARKEIDNYKEFADKAIKYLNFAKGVPNE